MGVIAMSGLKAVARMMSFFVLVQFLTMATSKKYLIETADEAASWSSKGSSNEATDDEDYQMMPQAQMMAPAAPPPPQLGPQPFLFLRSTLSDPAKLQQLRRRKQ